MPDFTERSLNPNFREESLLAWEAGEFEYSMKSVD
jgi:hypothetical protein